MKVTYCTACVKHEDFAVYMTTCVGRAHWMHIGAASGTRATGAMQVRLFSSDMHSFEHRRPLR